MSFAWMTRIPQQPSFYGQLLHGYFMAPGIRVDSINDTRTQDCLKQCDITPSQLESLASDRTDWRSMCKSAIQNFEAPRVHKLEAKGDLWKFAPPSTSDFQCQICQRMRRSCIRWQQIALVMMRPMAQSILQLLLGAYKRRLSGSKWLWRSQFPGGDTVADANISLCRHSARSLLIFERGNGLMSSNILCNTHELMTEYKWPPVIMLERER